MNILKLYTLNKTDMRNNLKELGSINNAINKIQNSKLDPSYKFRTDIGYPLKRNNINNKLEREFINPNNKISLEHAEKFYLYEYSRIHKKKIDNLGYVIGYELPFFKNRGSGAIDLVTYDNLTNTINLVELKNCAMGNKEDSKESILRAILEIETYTKFINEIIKEETNNRLLEDITKSINNLYNLNVDLSKIKEAKITKNILIPKSIYTNSMNNIEEKMYLNNLNKDINVLFISLKDKSFNTSNKIGLQATKPDIIFSIERLNN